METPVEGVMNMFAPFWIVERTDKNRVSHIRHQTVDAQFFNDDVVHLQSQYRVGQGFGLQKKRKKEDQSV
jgi:hypothetical protein